jgi:hypothetical protein
MTSLFAHSTASLSTWLQATALSHAMVTQPWLWAICETLHFVGLALLIGTAGVFDLRLLGFIKRVSLGAVMDLRGWAALGLLINLVTGVMFMTGAPSQYLHNAAWWWKVAFIAVAGLNIAVFELRPGTRALVASVGANDDTPLRLKLAGGVSLFSWFAVLYFGRMLPFIGNAF